MQNSDSERQLNQMIYSYGREKQNKIRAYYLLITGIVVFLLTLSGLTDSISEWIGYFLLDNLGYTNKWSKTFGPKLFVHLMSDIAALSGKVFILISIIHISVYYRIRNEQKEVWRFLGVVLGGISFLILVKLIFAENVPDDPLELLLSDIGSFPSGHAFMAMVFYLTIAVMFSRKQKRTNVRKFIINSASVIIFLVGMSRIFGAKHDLNEVLAGWSLGLIWVCACWLVERFIKINYKLELK